MIIEKRGIAMKKKTVIDRHVFPRLVVGKKKEQIYYDDGGWASNDDDYEWASFKSWVLWCIILFLAGAIVSVIRGGWSSLLH